MRATPPSHMPNSRRELFSSALEQAEQQFRAAESIGIESRPLNIYYGLAQAGRAIAAAHTPDGTGVSPEVLGHGLSVPGLSTSKPSDDILCLRVRGDGRTDSSFGRMASLLDSNPLTQGVDLAAVAAMLLELSLDEPVPGRLHPKFLENYRDSEDHFELPVPDDDAEARRLKIDYPQIRSAELLDEVRGFTEGEDGKRIAIRKFHLPRFRQIVSTYRGSPAAMPACGNEGMPVDPILAWWLMVYTLSMAARYRPVLWTRAVDVDQSVRAVWLEQLLEKSLDAIPHQVLITLSRSPAES